MWPYEQQHNNNTKTGQRRPAPNWLAGAGVEAAAHKNRRPRPAPDWLAGGGQRRPQAGPKLAGLTRRPRITNKSSFSPAACGSFSLWPAGGGPRRLVVNNYIEVNILF